MGFFKVNGINLIKDNEPVTLIGCNMYGLGKVADWQAEQMIKDAKDEGFEAIRFWAFEPMDKVHLNYVCEQANKYGMFLIPVLADKWGYLQNYKITHEWYRTGYKNSYLPYAIDMVKTFKNREEIIAWEIINEPITDSFESIYNFSVHITNELKSANQNHLLSIGTVGGIGDKFGNAFSIFNFKNYEELFSITGFDMMSVHDYSHDSTAIERLEIYFTLTGKNKTANVLQKMDKIFNIIPDALDKFWIKMTGKTLDLPGGMRNIWRSNLKRNIKASRIINKPIYAGEIGFKKKHKQFRYELIKNDYLKKLYEGFCGYFLWSYESMGASYDGHGYGLSVGELRETISEIKNARKNLSRINNRI